MANLSKRSLSGGSPVFGRGLPQSWHGVPQSVAGGGYPSPWQRAPQSRQVGSPGEGYSSPGWMGYPIPNLGNKPIWIIPQGKNLETITGVPLPQVRNLGPATGYPPERAWDQWKYYGMKMGYLREDIRPVEALWDRDGVTPTLGVNGQTPVKTLSSPSFWCGQ